MIWKPVRGFEKYYLVSDTGEVYSTRRKINLQPSNDKDGYLKVTLHVDGKGFYRRVHQLVAMAFIPNPQKFPHVNHINENKQDNRVENLEWISPVDNDNWGTRNSRISATKCTKPILHIESNGKCTEYAGVKEASRATGMAHSSIARWCRSPYNTEWRYL